MKKCKGCHAYVECLCLLKYPHKDGVPLKNCPTDMALDNMLVRASKTIGRCVYCGKEVLLSESGWHCNFCGNVGVCNVDGTQRYLKRDLNNGLIFDSLVPSGCVSSWCEEKIDGALST